jgi:hypothetical protein
MGAINDHSIKCEDLKKFTNVKQMILGNKKPFEDFDLYFKQKVTLPENFNEKHKPALK